MRKIQKCHENPLDNILIGISDSLCPLFKKLGFTPNGITTLSLIFGLAAVYALYKGKVWGFAILYFISYFFDNMDGHYARKYGMTSKFGDYYDHIKDIVVVLVLLGVLITRNRCSRKVWITAGAILAVAFVLMSAQLGCQEKIYKSTPDQPIFYQPFMPRRPGKVLRMAEMVRLRDFCTGVYSCDSLYGI